MGGVFISKGGTSDFVVDEFALGVDGEGKLLFGVDEHVYF